MRTSIAESNMIPGRVFKKMDNNASEEESEPDKRKRFDTESECPINANIMGIQLLLAIDDTPQRWQSTQ